MKYFAYIFSILFVVFAVLQYNDPDPYLWIPIYLSAAWLSWQVSKGKYQMPLLIGFALAYLVGAFYYFPPSISTWIHAEEQAKSLQMKMPFVEEARESMGLMICFVVMLVYVFAGRRKQSI